MFTKRNIIALTYSRKRTGWVAAGPCDYLPSAKTILGQAYQVALR